MCYNKSLSNNSSRNIQRENTSICLDSVSMYNFFVCNIMMKLCVFHPLNEGVYYSVLGAHN